MSILLLLVTFSLVACGKVTVKLSGDAQVKVGQTINLTPEASKKGATFTWASSNDAVATVNNGAVTGVSAGKVTITVTAKSGKKTGEASLEITVVASNKPVISGADDVQILKGERFAPMDGVTARDEEDGDLTNQIDIQGSVNYNLVGEYTVTYTVRDNEGNVTTVVRKVTVVANDTDAPLLTGTQNKTIIIGDAAFKLTDNVSANDAIDGDVSANIQVSGELNIWKLGDYEIKYSVTDAAGNEAKATRIITVGLGEFQFEELADKEFTKEGNDYQFAVALESINTQLSDFALAKLSFKVNAAAACELVPAITNGTAQAKIELAAGDNEITIYFRVNSAIAEGALKLTAPEDANLTFTEVKFAFAEAKDVTAPVINVPEGKIVLPADVDDLNVLKGFILNGVTAQDNVDMVMNSKLDVDMTGIAAGTYEEKQVTIFAIDTAGNRGEATRTVEFAKAYSTNLIADPTFSTDSRYEEGTTDPIWEHWRLHGGAGDPEMYIADGVLVHHNRSTDAPGYDSASCPIIDTDSTVLQGGNWYMLKFDVKAAVARQMTVRIGLAADAPVWLENFAGASNYPLNVSTEFETKYVVFYVHANASADGYTGISCELKNGTFEWNSEKEIGNTFYFDNLQFYLLSNQNAAPTLKINGELPTTFGKGQEKPDLTQYVIAYDREDARNIEITAAHITEAIDMNTPGTYDVVYKVADSEGAESTITLKIKVLEEADTVAPVLTEAEGLVKVFDQFSATPDITKFITATDAVDGPIEITMDMIETNANINKAGTYDIVYTVKDSSGNVATLTVTITVNDKEAPKVEGKDLKTYAGTALSAADIIANFTVTDNVDGAITLTEAMVKGLADVDFTKPGEYQVIIEVVDAAGNKTEHPVKISVREKGNTISVPDEVILDLAPLAPAAAEFCAVTETEGEYKVEISAIGDWASANKMKFNPTVVQGETYVLRFTAKADKARSVQFNIGEAMDGNATGVWMEKYPLAEEGTDVVALTTDYKTFDIMFTVQNEKFEWGPTIEFCVGPVAGACENGNNIYFTELAIYSVKEIGDVNLLPVTIDPQHHIAGEGLVISKATNSGNWDWIAFKPEETDLEGYDKIVAKVYGPKDGILLFKPNDLQPKETRYTMNGQWQEIEHALDFTLDASKQALLLMPDADVVGTGKYYLIASLELQGEGKDPINLLDATITKADPCTAQKALTLTKAADNAEQYDCAKFQVSDDLTGYAAVKYAIIGAPGFNTIATLKPNDNGSYQRQVTLDGTLQEGMIDLTGMQYNPAKSAMILFVDLLVNGTDNPVFILEMKYIVEKPAEPEPENPGHVEPVAVNQSSPTFASWEGLQTVTFTGLPAENSGNNGWARWDFDSVTDKGYTDVVVKFKATPGLRICAKIDASTTPESNAYDAIKGNKTTQVAGEDGLVTFTWNLAEFKAAAEAAGKAFAVENIRKCVVFPSSGLEGDAALTTGSIELISIDFVKAEEVYVPVYPEAVADSIDLLTGTINPKTIQVAHQIRMMKNGGGAWNWVGLLYNGDLTGYTTMVAEITGPEGAAFTFKVNDTLEKGVTTTGEALAVEFDLPEGFTWDASKKAMIMFPDFNIPGLGNEFTLTKLELQGADKDPIDLLVCEIVVDANVKACRDLVLTKTTNNTEQWDCIEITVPTDLTGATEVKYVVSGTQGDVLCIKPNNNQDAESWIEMTGKAMEGTINFANATYNSNAPAMVVFPNIGTAGSGNPFIISQLVYVKPEVPVLTGVKVSGAADVALAYNAEGKVWEGKFEISALWGSVAFAEVYSDSSTVALTYNNATFSGDGILSAKAAGSPENAQLYADEDAAVAAGNFCHGISAKTTYKVTYNPETKAVVVNVVEPESELVKMQIAGTVSADLVKNEETGVYEGSFTLTNIWSNVRIEKVFADESVFSIKYSNAKIVGSAVLDAPHAAPSSNVLYADVDGTSAANGQFFLSKAGETHYSVSYNPATNTLSIDFAVPAVPASIKAVKYDGAKQGDFVLKDGKYEALVELGAWNRISFVVVAEDDSEVALWYTNAKFEGAITAADKLGDAWNKYLYHEAGDGARWMPGQALKYKLVYDPATNTMTVSIDKTAPVVTVADAVLQALAAANLTEGQDASALFAQLLAGLSANDDFDGAITVTQEMVDLGGLTLNQLVAGDYKVTVTVKDAAGNEGKAELPVHVAPYPYTKHTLDASTMTQETIEAALTVDNFFTVLPNGTKVVVDGNNKNAGSVSFTQRLKLGGKSTTSAGAVKFVTKSSSVKVTVYAYSSSSSENRNVHIFGEDGVAVATKLAYGAGEITILEAVLDKPGTYFIGGLEAAINIYGVVVEEGYTAPAAPANVDLLADMPAPKADYKSPNWKVEKYTTDWTVQTDVQMRSRTSDGGAIVTNMANGYGMTMRFTYGTGSSLGLANTLSFKMGNYWSDKAEMSIKIKVVTVAGKEIYVLGSSSEWYAFHTTTDVEDFNLHFDAAEIKQVVFVTKSALQKSTYLYVGSLHLTYELSSQEHPLTVEEALDIAARMSRSSDDVQEVWVKGYVVNAGADQNTYVQNIKIASTLGGKPALLIFSANKGADITKIYVNDEILIHGYLMNYSGTLEISSTKVDGQTQYSEIAACKVGNGTVSVSETSSEHATVKEISAETGANGSTFTFKVDVENGHEIESVTVNGVAVSAVEGVYTAVIGGPTQILVQTTEAGVVVLPSLSFDGSTPVVAGGAATTDMSVKNTGSDYYYQTGGTAETKYSYQILGSKAYFAEAPAKLIVTVKIGTGSNKDLDDDHAAYAVLLDKDGNEIESTRTMITKSFKTAAVEYTIEIVPTAAFAGIKVYETKVASWNMRLYSITVEVDETPASSPAAFQLANLEAEGNARNHIEGAGAWIWIDASSMGLTAENKAEFTVEAETSGQAPAIVGQQLDDLANGAVRCYVTFANAEFAATTTINLTIHHGDVAYQGTVIFSGNELAQ
ncbi:MAG: DUF5011 domain-containing protein [Bacilli bacterium]|nr:DUF5011 domain-containing protein [Bacilli bacterium]